MSGLPGSDAEPSAARKALTAAALTVLLCAAVVAQLTVVNRLPLPGGAAPDLVLLAVTAIAVCTSPLTGALAGFAGGLALDVAPPSIHYAGEYALVFCLAGWGAARVNRAITDVRGERDQMVTFAVMAGAAAAGEAGKAALGMMLSDPDVTAAAVSRLLPTAVLYDLLVAPFAFWLVARVTRGVDAERAPAPEFTVEQRLGLVFRSASAGAATGLRLAGTGGNYRQPRSAGRAPRLRLSGGRAGSGIATGAAAPGAVVPRPGGRTHRLSFGGDLAVHTGQVHTGPRASRALGKNWLRGATGVALAGSPALKAQTAAAARRAARGPGRGWLTAAGPAGLAGPSARRGPRRPGRGWISAAGPAGLAVPAARRAPRDPGRGWIAAGDLARSAGGGGSQAPGQGWIAAGGLAGPSGQRAPRRLGKGWIRAGGLAGPSGQRAPQAPGRGWITAGRLAAPSADQGSRTLGKGWITVGRLARPAGPRAARGPGRGWLSAARPGSGGLADPGRPRSAADALAARSAPSGLSALSGGGTPMAAGGSRAGRAIRGSAFRGSAFRGSAFRGSAFRGSGFRGSGFRGRRTSRGNWYTASPSGEWLRRHRHRRRWRQRGFLPGGRPPGARPMASPSYRARGRPGWIRLPGTPGARPMAKSAIMSAARKLGLFGGRW